MNPILIPIIVSILAYGYAAYALSKESGPTNIGSGPGDALTHVIYLGTATFVSLIVWFGWALFR